MEPYQHKDQKVKFMHFRLEDERGEVSPKGGATVAYAETDKGVEWSMARCNESDHYNKKVGRAVTHGRLVHGKGHCAKSLEELMTVLTEQLNFEEA